MRYLYNLSIRKKFAVVIVPLIITIICFDYLQIRHSYLDYNDAVRLNRAILLGVEVNHVVHELQRERSISSGYIANEGGDFAAVLSEQRHKTDSTIQQFYSELIKPEFKDLLNIHGDDLERLRSHFDRINEIRDQVDNLKVSSDQSIEYFSVINTTALNTVSDLINETRDKEIAQQVHAMINYLKSKEYASIERAVGTQAFSHKVMDFEMYNRFTTLVSQQNSYLDAFLTIASLESKEQHAIVVQGPHIDEVARLRQVLFSNQDLNTDPSYWYEVSTTKINALKKVEDYMSDTIYSTTNAIADDVFKTFWTFLIVDVAIGVIAFWLMTTVVSNLLDNVSLLERFTRKISAGDFTKKVKIDTKDEIGQYARTFNSMVEEIRKSHIALKKERDKARYLYENIYKQSQVVFENVQQGIFLLDKQFKISRLYSKAMESIFDTNKIAGENFSSFMRPLIIPRELEALEMFMRHLFNPDMDEEVVNQLNPVERVKIFTDKEGVVSTKYIRVSFTRIERKGVIKNIMVTVSDETKSILLQQHLEEAEAKKKQETEQVLSILKIDPSVMRGFLFNSKKTLNMISERYEKNDGENYRDLLDYTFETIHNLKGNASVIGLELMSAKFHSIEDSIGKLKERNVRGKDFLSILYEIDEADRMMVDMSEMLRKVANIYRKLPSEGQVVSNIMVINTLEKGVENISKELKKTMGFKFLNDTNVVIPEEYINPFKDIMIQLIRNTIVHGIEEGSVRKEKGKTKKGHITIELDQEPSSGEYLIHYYDDGEGLNHEKIRKKAIDRNLVTEFQSKKLSKQETEELIFENGFSTSEKADQNSGRGQGMNLIKTIVDENHGSFSVTGDGYFDMQIKLPPVFQDSEEEAEITS
ncbi:MAG: nitrate- and nitrite sensing domain-containing protein [Cytophagales bacterium]|nr:nitrate- and nitrite sensing domain-containing protein [Cytophagales bacterium]